MKVISECAYIRYHIDMQYESVAFSFKISDNMIYDPYNLSLSANLLYGHDLKTVIIVFIRYR